MGCPPEVPVTGERKSVKILGAIELWRTQFNYRQDTVFNASTYLNFLEQLARRYRRQGAILIQDNASYHKDAEVWSWFKSNRHWLEVHQLPPYSARLESHGTAVAAHAQNGDSQSILWWRGRPVRHPDACLRRDAVTPTTNQFLSGPSLLNDGAPLN